MPEADQKIVKSIGESIKVFGQEEMGGKKESFQLEASIEVRFTLN